MKQESSELKSEDCVKQIITSLLRYKEVKVAIEDQEELLKKYFSELVEYARKQARVLHRRRVSGKEDFQWIDGGTMALALRRGDIICTKEWVDGKVIFALFLDDVAKYPRGYSAHFVEGQNIWFTQDECGLRSGFSGYETEMAYLGNIYEDD